MRISDWSSDVCSSDLLKILDCRIYVLADTAKRNVVEIGHNAGIAAKGVALPAQEVIRRFPCAAAAPHIQARCVEGQIIGTFDLPLPQLLGRDSGNSDRDLLQALFPLAGRSEEHTSELQSLMRISYAVFCLKK